MNKKMQMKNTTINFELCKYGRLRAHFGSTIAQSFKAVAQCTKGLNCHDFKLKFSYKSTFSYSESVGSLEFLGEIPTPRSEFEFGEDENAVDDRAGSTRPRPRDEIIQKRILQFKKQHNNNPKDIKEITHASYALLHILLPGPTNLSNLT